MYYIKDRFEQNTETIMELNQRLIENSLKLEEYEKEKAPLEAALSELRKKYDYLKLAEDARKIPERIEELKTEHYVYFYLSALEAVGSQEHWDDFDLDGFIERYGILFYSPEEDFSEILRQKNKVAYDKRRCAVYFAREDEDYCSDDEELLVFKREYTPDELQTIMDDLILTLKVKKVMDAIPKGMFAENFARKIDDICNQYGVIYFNNYVPDPLGVKLYVVNDAGYYKVWQLPIHDEKTEMLIKIPESADLDILALKLKKDFILFKEKIKNLNF